MCMSLAPLSTMARSSCWRVNFRPVGSGASTESVPHGDATDLLGRRDSLEDLLDAAHPEGHHPTLDRRGLQLGGRGTLEDHLLQGIGEAHDLVERDTAAVAGAVAVLATGTFHQGVAGRLLLG